MEDGGHSDFKETKLVAIDVGVVLVTVPFTTAIVAYSCNFLFSFILVVELGF